MYLVVLYKSLAEDDIGYELSDDKSNANDACDSLYQRRYANGYDKCKEEL